MEGSPSEKARSLRANPVQVSKDEQDTQEPARRFTLRVLYLFAGAERKTSVVAYLKSAAEKRGWDLAADEIDLRRSSSMDLTEEQLQDRLISLIEQGGASRDGIMLLFVPHRVALGHGFGWQTCEALRHSEIGCICGDSHGLSSI